jgi:hypothetical protein
MKACQKFTILFFIAALILTACAKSRDQRLAEEVVENFHRLYNQQNYEEIFNSAHEEAKRTKSKEALGLALAQSFEKYGKHLSSELVYTKITPVSANESSNPNEKKVELAYKSKFENGERNETFLILSNGEKASLYGIGELTNDELEKLKSK